MPAQQLSAFACGLRLADVPKEVQHQAKRTLLNYFGCACGGARHSSVDAVIAARAPWSGRPVATVIGRREMFDPMLVALLNGMSSAVYSFDDTHAAALVHPGGPVASAVLALAQVGPTSGADLLLAFVVGAEIVCRLSKAVSTPPAQGRPEWVQTGICAGVGAAAGAANILDLPERQAISALGVAASRASGLRSLSRSMCFSYMAGSAAEAGVSSALLVQGGMIGPDEFFAGGQGFCASFSIKPHLDYLTGGLGVHYELAANTFKPYPCGVVIHPVIDACLALAGRIADAAAIEQIVVQVHPATEKLANIPAPKDQFEAQVSMQHWTACAFVDRAAGVAQSDNEHLASPEIAAMRQRVSIKPHAGLSREAVRVDVRLRSGETLSESVEGTRGSLQRPLSDRDIEAKYFDQATPTLGKDSARELAEACWQIDRLPDASRVLNLATGK